MRYTIIICLFAVLSCNNTENGTPNMAQNADSSSVNTASSSDTLSQESEEDLEEVVDVLKTVKP